MSFIFHFLRSAREEFDTIAHPRQFRPPIINLEAASYTEMIDWTGPKTEPPLTMDLTELELLEIIEKPLVLPPFPCHTLDVERLVPVVTESALHSIGPVNRHRQYITAVLVCPYPRIISHKLFSGGLSKL